MSTSSSRIYSSEVEMYVAQRKWDKEFSALMNQKKIKGRKFESYNLQSKLPPVSRSRNT